MSRIVYSLIFLCFGLLASAQEGPAPAMAEGFRADGKIWVVISVIALVFLALVGWLIALERRIGKIENSIHPPSGKS